MGILDADNFNTSELKEPIQFIQIAADELDYILKRTVNLTFDMKESGEKSFHEMSKET